MADSTINIQPQRSTAAMPNPARDAGDDRRNVSWVGKGVVFKGELSSSEDMRIEGRVEGLIDIRNHDLIVGPGATLKADVIAKTITVRGNVVGKLTASDRIEIRETATIEGEVAAPRLAITEGATIQGQIRTTQAAKAVEDAPQPRLATAG